MSTQTRTSGSPVWRARVAAYNAKRQLIEGTARRLLGTITHVVTEAPVAALTFDDGPHPIYTPLLLDVLARHKAKATFFVIGQQVRQHPEIVRRMLDEGHALANHTFDHPFFLKLSSEERRRQLRECARAIGPRATPMFRPPRGHQSVQSRVDIMRAGYDVVTWNLHAEDWRRHDAEWMAARLVGGMKPGSIVLLHDAIWDPQEEGVTDRRPVVAAVDLVLNRLDRKFRFVTVPELLRYGRAGRVNWVRGG